MCHIPDRAPPVPPRTQNLPAQAVLQAALSGVTLSGASLSLLLFTQLLPPALAGQGPSHASCGAAQLYVRSSSPEVVHAVQLGPRAFLADMSGGTLLAAGPSAVPRPGTGRPRPAIDDRVAALLRTGGLAQPPSKEPAVDADADAGTQLPATTQPPPGAKVSHVWLRNAAAAEWQRLACGSV